ncbi:MAG TPA: Asp-tRNA(Asn)/Glu-tRNA(Gln) amidotransferase GatCAB subunit A [Clostridiales bacterium UBA9857]|jgi:aspartyl-tRNA(Asn)/glutamyl-tRNA(Gln) amidotransferase subunit A|nr:Asp-tRNA(Asn)/Glu-tRNA(Gln) amidotransferase GatCAB subunit A [Clostridiales bacterium UBA9857]HOP70097.1 Asp-tRNA(Asn)/Glu-tRNA(Gln) amidotransferase subunit GatA [Bacillota bacterium]HPT35440.1 Asp-tRNA(Asn)/Glu-tRNA(Gln) amidotransferase subunit GatA [Bacillota bacterium]
MEIRGMPARDILRYISSGEVSAAEVVETYLDAIREIDPQTNAFIEVLEPAARADASRIDKELRDGGSPGILAGLPVAIKDNICVKGAGCTCGSKILENWIAPYDATAARRLREQGAVIIGKTNMDEFAMGSSTETSAYGVTRNPWDLSRVPGGSSGGSAVAVAAGMAPLALGTDTGGSIRQPASFTGICGLKPTYGLVSRYGVTAYASSLDTVGPFGEGVWDCALLLEVIAGHDPLDATSHAKEPVTYTKALDGNVAGLRVGVPQELLRGVSAPVKAVFESTLSTMEDMGMIVEEMSLPSLAHAVEAYYVIAAAEASSNLARFDGVRFGRRADAGTLDEMYTRSRGEGFGKEVIKRIILGTFVLDTGNKDRYYRRAAQVRTLIKDEFQKAFERFDLIVSPAAPDVAFKIGEKIQDPLTMYLADLITIPVNMAGVCALSMPMGFAECDGVSLPCGLQIIGKPFDEQTVLRAGYCLEQEIGAGIREKVRHMRQNLGPVRECELVD